MITRTDPKPTPKPEPTKKVIALVHDGRTTFFNPAWELASCPKCPNCDGAKCALCKFEGVYRE